MQVLIIKTMGKSYNFCQKSLSPLINSIKYINIPIFRTL